MDGLPKGAVRSLQSFRVGLTRGSSNMQVIYSNAALAQVNNGCPANQRAALFDEIAQLMQANQHVRNNPERYDTETKNFQFSIQDPRWQLILATAYVSRMEKTGHFWNRTFVAPQVMVIAFQ